MADKIIFKTLMLKGDAGEPTDQQTQAAVDQYMQDHPEAAIDETIINSAVADWLGNHPEATTTVQDSSLTYKKLINGTLNFVTPEMFGAKGDGVTDDTTAFQAALDSGKPVFLKDDANYYIGTVTFTDAIIIGNGATITNNDDDCLLSGSTLYIENVNIINPSIFDYQTGVDSFACIYTANCYALNVTMTEVNRIGIWLNNGVIDGFNVNTTFDVGANYDGSANNNLYGIYFDQQETSKHIEVKNSTFKNLIEGIYVGTRNDNWKFAVSIHGNLFDTIVDHCVYINSEGDRCSCDIYNNVALKVATAFVLSGNNCRLHDNIVYGGYVSSVRQTFGLSIRHGSNIKIDHNVFVLENYKSSSGIGASIGITSLISTISVMENISFEDNVFNINELDTSIYWIRIGYNQNIPIKNLRFERNKITITGHSSLFNTNVSIDGFLFKDNDIVTSKNCFDATMTMPLTVIGNKISNNNSGTTFGLNVCGIWEENKFTCDALPIRKATANTLITKGNSNTLLNGSVYNHIDATNLINNDVWRGEFTSTSQSTAVLINNPLLHIQYRKQLFVMDTNHQPVSYTVNSVVNGTISISIPAGSYYYTII